MVGDPRGAGEVLAGVAEGLTECGGLGDRVGLGEVLVGDGAGEVGEGEVCVGADVCAGAVEEEVVPGCVVSADAGRGTGRTRM